jgi:hypothetical protein
MLDKILTRTFFIRGPGTILLPSGISEDATGGPSNPARALYPSYFDPWLYQPLQGLFLRRCLD